MRASPTDVDKETRASHEQLNRVKKKKRRARDAEIAGADTSGKTETQVRPEPTISIPVISQKNEYKIQYPFHAYIKSTHGNAEGLSALLKDDNSFNIDSRDSNDKTLLELAVEKNDLAMVKVLVEHGANFDLFDITVDAKGKTSRENTPLFLAVQKLEQAYEEIHNEKPEVANYLKSLNNLQAKIKEKTSLDDAVKSKDLNLVVYHTQKEDFTAYAQNEQGFNALDQAIAIQKNHVKHNEATQIAVVLRSKGMEFTEKKQQALDNLRAARNQNIREFVSELNNAADTKINFNIDKFIGKLRFMGIKHDPKNKSQPFSFHESLIESATLLDPNFFNDFALPVQSHPNFFGFTEIVTLPDALQKKYDNVRNFFIDPTQSDLLWEDTARGHLEALRSNSLLADYTIYNVSALPNNEAMRSRIIYVDAINHKCKFMCNAQVHEVDLGNELDLRDLASPLDNEAREHELCKQRVLNFLNDKGFSFLHAMNTSAPDIVHAREIVQIVTNKKAREDKAIAEINTCLASVSNLLSDSVSGLETCITAMGDLAQQMGELEKNKNLSSARIVKELADITRAMEQLQSKTTRSFNELVELENSISSTAQKFSYLPEAKQLKTSIDSGATKKIYVSHYLARLEAFKQNMNELLPTIELAEKAADIENLTQELEDHQTGLKELITEKTNLDIEDFKLAANIDKMFEELDNPKKAKDLLIEQIDNLVKKHRHLDTGFFRSIGNSDQDKILAKELARIKKELGRAENLERVLKLASELKIAVQDKFLTPAQEKKEAFPMSLPRKQLLNELVALCSSYEELKSYQNDLADMQSEKLQLNMNIKEKEKAIVALEQRITELGGIVSDLDAESKNLSARALIRSDELPPAPSVRFAPLIAAQGIWSHKESSPPVQNDHRDNISKNPKCIISVG